jgi:hypothetical protein
LERQAVRDYKLVFGVGIGRAAAWSVLVGIANPVDNLMELGMLCLKIMG